MVYCFTQPINPGPTVLSPAGYSEADIRKRVAEISDVRQDTATILTIDDGSERAERLKPYVRSDIFPVRLFALEELGKCGPSAIPTISEMLDEPTFADEGSELVQALVQAGGHLAGEELNNRLRQDLAFWSSTAPFLPHKWLDNPVAQLAPLNQRYSRTFQLIVGLERAHNSAALKTARQLRDLWASLPQLADYGDITAECDKLIRELQPE